MGSVAGSKCCDSQKDENITIDLTKAHAPYEEPPGSQDEVPLIISARISGRDNNGEKSGGEIFATVGEEEKKEEPKEDLVAPVAPVEPVAENKAFQDCEYEELLKKVGDKIQEIESRVGRRPSSCGTSLQKYVDKHDSDTWTALKAMEGMDGWNLKKEEDGVKIFMKQNPGSVLMSFKAITEIEVDFEKFPQIVAELLNVEKRPEWDKMCIEARTVESYAPFYRVSYVKMLSPAAIIAPRDLCNLSRIRFETDGGVMMSLQNLVHADAPTAPNHVRAEVIIGGYIFRPLENKKGVRMIYCGTVDPKGWLPVWVANLVAWKQGLGLAHFKNSLKAAGIT